MAKENNRAGSELRAKGRKIIERIDAAGKAEKHFFDTAQRAEEIYANEGSLRTLSDGLTWSTSLDFNILFSNVETIVPAIINSPPAPDIRRRFNDTDPAAKDVSEILERSIRVQIDDSRLQIEMEKMAQDGFLGGRGLVRLRYYSEETEREDEEIADEAREVGDGASNRSKSDDPSDGDGREGYGLYSGGMERVRGGEQGASPLGDSGSYGSNSGEVTNERICFEAVSWSDFRHGPAKRWEDVPWQAFRHAIAKDDIESFADNALYASQALDEDRLGEDKETDIYVWEYWDKKSKRVWFVEENTGKVLKRVDDPLGLSCFFPICTPVQPIEINGRLMPVTPYAIYEKLATEVDLISMRIRFLTKAMKVKALYGGNPIDLSNLVEGDDADLIPIADPEVWASQGGLDGMLSWWPVEKFAVAIRELYTAREQAKQAIYEITGISDIIRGQGQASTSATAENIKSQWGSLRIQKMQRMMERAARDLFVMMCEIIPSKFSAQTIQDMTGIQLIPTEQDMAPLPPPQIPPQVQMAAAQGDQQAAQQVQQAIQQYQQAEQARMAKLQKLEAVNALLQNKIQKFYRIDVESDSTVRADMTRQRTEVAAFLQGAAQFWSGVVPAVQAGLMTMDVAAEIFASNSRMFNLGKSVEDAIDKMISDAKEKAKQPAPPNPEMIKAQMEQQKAQFAAQLAQAQAQQEQAKSQAQIATITAKLQSDQAKVQGEIRLKEIDAELKIAEGSAQLQRDTQTHEMEMQKLAAEIEKIRVGTTASIIQTQQKADLADRNQYLKESQANKEPAE